MASTAPVDGSSTTTAPSVLPFVGTVVSAFQAASCSFGCTVSVTLSVVGAEFCRKRIWPRVLGPCVCALSSELYSSSIPAVP